MSDNDLPSDDTPLATATTSSTTQTTKRKKKLKSRSRSTVEPLEGNSALTSHPSSDNLSGSKESGGGKAAKERKAPKSARAKVHEFRSELVSLPSSPGKLISDDASTSSNTSTTTHPARSSRSKQDELGTTPNQLAEVQALFEETIRRLEQRVLDLQDQVNRLTVTALAIPPKAAETTASEPPTPAQASAAAPPVEPQAKVVPIEPFQREIAILNVGGTEYATTLATLTKYPHSMLGVLFSGKFKITTDHAGRYFLDRDGQIFRYVLEFLRTNSIASVDMNNETLVRQVAQEAEYFQLTPLLEMLSKRARRVGSRQLMVVEGVEAQLPMYTRKEIHAMKLAHSANKNCKFNPMNLAGIDLPGIDLSRLDLSYTNFARTNLKGASFENCILIGCIFSQCNLQDANFQQCRFGYTLDDTADFTDAFLRGANFTRYIGEMFKANLEGADLTDTSGLDIRWLRGSTVIGDCTVPRVSSRGPMTVFALEFPLDS